MVSKLISNFDEIAEHTKLKNVVMKGMLRQINDESAVRHTPSMKRKDMQNRPYRDTCESMGLLTRNGWFREP